MFGPIRVAAIDDEPAHLLAITTGLSANGIPCTGYWYDRDTNQLMPEPAAGGLPLLRLIFMDLNLAELGGIPETATLCAGVMNVLKQLVAKDGGPYLLVFWTQVGAKVEDVGTMLRERLEPVEGVPPPIAVVGLDKGPFLVGEPKDKDFNTALKDFYAALHKIVPELAKIVNSVVSHDPQLCALSAWEGRAAEAAGRAVNEVNLCARNDVTDPSNTSTSIQGVLATIAVAASGPRPANAAPARALDAGMVDILVDQFGASVDDPDYQAVVQRAIGEAVKKKVAFRDDVQDVRGTEHLLSYRYRSCLSKNLGSRRRHPGDTAVGRKCPRVLWRDPDSNRVLIRRDCVPQGATGGDNSTLGGVREIPTSGPG